MSKLTITKIFHFEYAHFLPDYPGKCKNIHGHSGVLEVEVEGNPTTFTSPDGMICDFAIVSKVVTDKIIVMLDHTFINKLFFREDNSSWNFWSVMIKNPTAENMISWIVSELNEFFGEKLVRVRLWETKDSYAEWRA
jgi:6-pyruvoyltetrahydropterin/6-carboxytetrahydropterin synthase